MKKFSMIVICLFMVYIVTGCSSLFQDVTVSGGTSKTSAASSTASVTNSGSSGVSSTQNTSAASSKISNNTSSTASKVQSASSESDQQLSKRPIHIKLGAVNDPAEVADASVFAHDYMNINKDVYVEIVRLNSNYNQEMLSDIAAGTLPDVFWTAGDKHQEYSAMGVDVELTPYFTRDKISKSIFYPVLLDQTGIVPGDNKMYFVPRDYNQLVTFYNKDMFKAAGLAYPSNNWTWNDLQNDCKVLRQKMDANANGDVGLESDSYPIDTGMTWDSVYYSVIRGFGGDILDSNGKADFNTTNAKNAFTAMQAMIKNNYAPDPAQSQTDIFQAKKAAMWFTVRPRLSTSIMDGINVDFAPFPQMPVNAVQVVGCSGYSMSAKSTHKEESWGLLKVIMSVQGQNDFGKTGNGVPAIESLATTGTWLQYDSTSLNHKAFTMFQERNINPNYADKIDPSKINNVTDVVTDLIMTICDNNGNGTYSSLQAVIDDYTKQVNDAVS